MAEHPEDGEASPLDPAQPRRISPRNRPEIQKETRSANADALIKLAEVARVLSESSGREAEAADENAAGRATQKSHRFQRSAASQTAPAEVPLPGELARIPSRPAQPEPGPAEDAPPDRPARPRKPAPAKSRRPNRLDALRQHPFFVWIVVQVFCFGLVLSGVLLGSLGSGPATPPAAASAARKAASPPPAPAAARAASGLVDAGRAIHTADLALAKENAGDLSAARSLLESLASSPAGPPGAEYQLALLALRRGDLPNVNLHLERSIVANEEVAPCCYVRAALAGSRGDYGEASAQLQLAAEAAPFDGRYFFYWGEALRRDGKLPQAVAAIQQALTRPAAIGEWELYYFKWRLAQVEAGPDEPASADLQKNLDQPMPSGDWLLLAAAQNVQRDAFFAAAEFLQKAAHVLPPETYRTWVSDYAFQNYAANQEIARYLEVPPPSPVIVAGTPAPAAGNPSEAGEAPYVPVLPIAVPTPPPPPVRSGSAQPGPIVPDPTVCSPAAADPALWRTPTPNT